MENFREFDKEQKQNWLKGIVALTCLQKPLALFVDEEIEIFHGELGSECGPDHCVKECDFNNWKPRPKQSPPLDCEVCSRWRDVIWPNHTSQYGKVMWLNSKPHLWSRDKWEVAKVYMPDGHKNHNSVDDFDIAALLCLMRQCKHFKKFELGGLCDKVSNVRNNIMHAPSYQLEQKDLQDYFNRIRELGEVLARHVPKFKNLSEEIDEIQNLDFRLLLPDDIAAQKNGAKDEKELEDIYFALAQEEAEHLVTRMELEKQKQDKLALAQEEAEHLVTRMELEKQEQDKLAVAQREAEHLVTRMKLEKLERQMAQLEQDDLTEYYDLTHKPRGLCVIINNEEFLGTYLKNRPGSQRDESAVRTVFTRLGFDVVTYNNLTAGAMRHELQHLGSRNFLDDDALVVCVLTHGEEGCVFGTDGQKVKLRELTQPFTSRGAPALAGKPKLFFIQACQGKGYQRGSVPCAPRSRQEVAVRRIRLEEDAGPEDAGCGDAGRKDAGCGDAGRKDAGHPGSMPCPPRPREEEVDRQSHLEEDAGPVRGETVPWDADFLLGMAAVPESKSFRNTTTGSIYIQELCAQLTRAAESLGKADILDVLRRVNREVSKGDYLNYKQMPEPRYTLTKKLVLKFV